MLTAVETYIKDIVVLSLFSIFAQMLLPNTNFRGYIKIVTGIVVMAAILKPLGEIVNINGNVFDTISTTYNNEFIVENNDIDIDTDKILQDIYKQNVGEQICNMLNQKGYEVNEVVVKTVDNQYENNYMAISEVKVYLNEDMAVTAFGGEDSNYADNDILNIIEENTDVKPENIEIYYN